MLAEFGRIDVLVNNAVNWGSAAPNFNRRSEDVPAEEWLPVVRHNIEGTVHATRAVTLTPAGRLNTPEDVAATVVFLGSAANTAITGEAIKASGGR